MRDYICEDRYKRNTEYEIYGVVNHFGSLNGGHYTANCKTDQGWYNFDDSRASKISESSIFNNNAYLLFYKRKHFNPVSENDFKGISKVPTGLFHYMIPGKQDTPNPY